ncbi:ATP-binding protein [Ferrovibrio sp.]|uniref:sensor histidine kinase n=1 Tax=Ferrovibrio sp. TaxID=1917215 RepID=UPI0025C5B082|nr:ATP-binding protein [Ferrovibrio sp.]MBX3453865.1 hypothetical protein [Ferrovibrio sp.]
MAEAEPSRLREIRQGIGIRLLALILLVSSAATLLATGLQLYLDYRSDVAMIQTRLDDIERSSLVSLADGLWRLEQTQLRLQLEGMLRLPDMRALQLDEISGDGRQRNLISLGEPDTQASPSSRILREMAIHHTDRGQQRLIGHLRVEATLDGVYRRLADKAVVILATQGVKTFLVSLFILFIVHRLVTRHLADIARYVDSFKIEFPQPLLELRRPPRNPPDELDRMVSSFNAMCETLRQAYMSLQEAHAELERDIEARRAAEAEVTRLNEALETRVQQRTAELEAANRELAAFSYSVSHDLRAPLRRIEGFGKALEEDGGPALDERGRHYLSRIRNAARDMTEMVDSFLRLSRAAAGSLTIESVDLSRLARLAAEKQQEKDPQRRVAVSVMTGLSVEGDRRLLTALLENLFENAWKYTRDTEAAAVSFSAGPMDGRMVYTVRDNGAGFDMEQADLLFTPFTRLHGGEEFEGTGIGLATVQRILARHGGRVWAEAVPGQGAAFHFTFWENGRNA